MPNPVRTSGLQSAEDAETVRDALGGVPDVDDAAVDWRSGRAALDGDAELDDLVDAVESPGFSARS